MAPAVMHRVLDQQFGRSGAIASSSFRKRPAAAASIGQVHRGYLGTTVARRGQDSISGADRR